MPEQDLSEAIFQIKKLLSDNNLGNSDSTFDCLAEIELLCRDAMANHSITELLRVGVHELKSDYEAAA